ncbi:MAG: hypothetical protein QOK37_4041 [Thermoanaerobaculia bacterium]|jgi:hypothetical protein|nr:hypothetical protein [Thermoanaerobaculia bacterium]
MKRIMLTTLLLALSLRAFAETKCHMKFTLSGWSAFYKTAHGSGTVTCDNGQRARVKLSSKGGGITFGRSQIDGIGTFSDVSGIAQIFGTYVQSEAHAGAGKSAKASAMTKGEVSLSIVGKGQGVDVGIAFGKFTIERAGR